MSATYFISIFLRVGGTASVQSRLRFNAVLRSPCREIALGIDRSFQLAAGRLHGVFVRRRRGEHLRQLGRRQDVDSAPRESRRRWMRPRPRPRHPGFAQQRRIFRQSGRFVRSWRRRYGTLKSNQSSRTNSIIHY